MTDVALDRKGTLALHDGSGVVEVPVRPTLVTNNAKVMVDAILGGRGVGTAQAPMVEEALAGGQLVRVLPGHELRSSDLFLAYPSAKYLRPLVRGFIDFAVTSLGRSRLFDVSGPELIVR